MSTHPGDASPESTSPTSAQPTSPARELTRRERDVLTLMIDHAPALLGEPVEEADRARWRAQLATVRAGRGCACGECPSTDLTDATGVSPAGTDGRVVLSAQTGEAHLLLFIDDDQLSYLELASTTGGPFTELPDPGRIVTTVVSP